MNVYLRGWRTSGLRCPDMEIDFGVNVAERQICLVQMPNGTGKSTIIELISACLTGEKLSPDRVRALQEIDGLSDKGTFELHLLIKDPEGSTTTPLDFHLDLDFTTETSEYRTLKNVQSGLQFGWGPPDALRPFLNNRCVDVFVFKGDRVLNLLDSARNDAEASIKAFFGFSAVEELLVAIDQEFASRNVGVGKTDTTVTRRRNDLQKWHNHLVALRSQLDNLQTRRRDSENGLGVKREQYANVVGRHKRFESEIARLTEEIAHAKAELSDASSRALSALRNPIFVEQAIGQLLSTLKLNLDTLKLPGTSVEFFRELTQQEKCVCDRPMVEAARQAVLANARGYLSDDHVMIVNGIKKDVENFSIRASEQRREDLFPSLESAVIELRRKEQELARVNSQLADESTDEERNAIKEWERALQDAAEIDRQLNELTGESEVSASVAMKGEPDLCKNIRLVERVVNEKERALAESQDTVREFNAKESLKGILVESARRALDELGTKLAISSNKTLESILPAGTPLKILSVKKNITLGFEAGAQKRTQTQASGGQNVAVAYSFSMAVLEKSGALFPLVVDHPVTALQESARREMAESLSRLCHQFVGFVIDTEKSSFLDALQATGVPLKFFTIYRNIEGNRPYEKLLPVDRSRVTVTRNATVCTDASFFVKFRDIGSKLAASADV
jgi:DNA sulfur modification protein DndD